MIKVSEISIKISNLSAFMMPDAILVGRGRNVYGGACQRVSWSTSNPL